MDLQTIISSAVISTCISVIGSIIVATITRRAAIRTAKETASHEMDKLQRTWDHDDVVSSDEEFAEMASIVSKFASMETGAWDIDALSKVAEVRSRESGTLGSILDDLYRSIKNNDFSGTDALLSKAIEEKRRLKQKPTP